MTTNPEKSVEEKLEYLKSKLPSLKGAHYIDIQIKINGETKLYEADFLREYSR